MNNKTDGVILGTTKGLSFSQIYPWASSAAKTGNRVVLLSMEKNDSLVLQMKGIGIEVVTKIVELKENRSPHNERFLLQYEYLNSCQEEYAVMTDVRDVIFQTNPIEWMVNNLENYDVVCGSEAIAYKDEPWNNRNLIEGYPYLYDTYKDTTVMNVGVLGGKTKCLAGVSLAIYTLCKNNPAYLSDQSSFNVLCGIQGISSGIYKARSDSAWSLNAGTLIREATGGAFTLTDNTLHLLKEPEPKLENGIAKTHEGITYSILHQWDRIPNWKSK